MNAMHSTPLVSAIIIFLNEERFLSEAVESVLGQSYSNWELLLVDDGSSDASTGMARRYSEQHAQRVRYLEHSGHMNRGMSASRNLGIQHANGEYVALLDADDVWLPHKLERQLAIMEEQTEAVMVYGATELWYSWTGRSEDIPRDMKQAIGVEANTLVKPPELLMLFLARKAITPCPSDVLVRRETVTAVGGFVDSFSGMYEDQIFFAKVTLKAAVFVSGECFSRHRQHPNSSSSVWRRTGEYYSAEPNIAFLEWIKTYLHSRGMKDPTIEKIIQRRLWRYHHPALFRMFRKLRHIAASVWSSLAN
jgi:glycosyltransferase involved in cell wall biosynthesis